MLRLNLRMPISEPSIQPITFGNPERKCLKHELVIPLTARTFNSAFKTISSAKFSKMLRFKLKFCVLQTEITHTKLFFTGPCMHVFNGLTWGGLLKLCFSTEWQS